MTKDQLQEMLESAVHYGHKPIKWNPKMKKYIYGVNNGVHVIDLQKSADCLAKAGEYLNRETMNGKRVLLVSTKPQATKLILEAARETGMPYVVNKWMGGLLTNFSTIKRRIQYYKKLKEEERTGDFDKYTKKEASQLKKVMVKLESALGGVIDMDRLPDIVFVADVVRDHIAVKEANKLNIPVVGIADTNADPDKLKFPIPGNDDAIKSLTYLINAVKKSIVVRNKQ